ncbi:M23 family metallopeptidase [Calidithermus timidus]|jgi:murein DD-endopeptidase MepM/ murein hydrolase activator NlpD|uniref:M23 family metallopeptidase n=1 Tax=Calidithermus timidus TaxID=307124 RepID=UPI0003751CE1|nr:M23 family metallopeptidase [Calidithermus timidus]
MRRSRPSSNPAQWLSVGISLPLWVFVLGWALSLGMVLYLGRSLTHSEKQEARLEQLTQQARKLQLALQAEQSRNEAYALEVVQMRQSLQALEGEINRLRAKSGLPRVRLLPEPTSPPPRPQDPKEPRGGAGEAVELGDLLIELRVQAEAFSYELESLEQSLANPLPDEPMFTEPRGAPLRVESHVTSLFGYRTNPFGGGGLEFHNGLDLAAPPGTPVYATAQGTVEEAGWNPVFGLMVLIDHHNGYRTLYGHLSSLAVSQGQRVRMGQMLGQVGSTGRSTGPHLHYSVFRYGAAVDPQAYLFAQALR